jgi:RimJ/RimL family protein N-acetyltransferase
MLAPSGRNIRAIKVYEKAGFQLSDNLPESLVPDYYDTVVMIKKMF